MMTTKLVKQQRQKMRVAKALLLSGVCVLGVFSKFSSAEIIQYDDDSTGAQSATVKNYNGNLGFLEQEFLNAKSVLVIDNLTGKPLVEKLADKTVSIASVSKLMTAMVAIDERMDLSERITLIDSDFKGAKVASSKLKVGDTLNRAELMLMMLMKSDNPAAKAVARTSRNGYAGFVDAMNKKANAIGMKTAMFYDTSGLDSRNVASSYDVARMAVAASEYGVIKEFSAKQKYTFYFPDRVLEIANTNAIVRDGKWNVTLSKTGYINEAGRCMVMQAYVNNRPTTIVLMGGTTSAKRTEDAQHILGWLQNYSR